MAIYHQHHIIPKHAGGSNDPSNLIKLTVEEHAAAHKKLWEEHGRREDWLAWKTLSGMISNQEIIQERCRLSAIKNARKGIPRPEHVKDKISQSMKNNWKKSDYVDRNKKSLAAVMATNEYRKNASISAKKAWEKRKMVRVLGTTPSRTLQSGATGL